MDPLYEDLRMFRLTSRKSRMEVPIHLLQSVQGDSILLSGFPWPIEGNPDNILESSCISKKSCRRV
jgi:hypothetical protein